MTHDVSLIADIGGTHARFAIALPDNSLAQAQVITQADTNAADCVTLCDYYLQQLPTDYRIRRAAWAVAGPVTGDAVTITNRQWHFSQRALQAHFGWDDFIVVNDFAALALSLPHLPESDKIQIKPGTADAMAPMAVIGPGTGLGVAGLVPHKSNWLVVPGEGGHVALPPLNEAEDRILQRLRQTTPYVMAEHVLSGRGLVHLAQVMAPATAWTSPRQIQEALAAGDEQAAAVVAQFCAFLGTVAGDAALTLGARGGVYLAGGILPKLVTSLQQSAFARRFTDKDVVKPYLEAIPVWLITHPLPAFLGLQNLLEK